MVRSIALLGIPVSVRGMGILVIRFALAGPGGRSNVPGKIPINSFMRIPEFFV